MNKLYSVHDHWTDINKKNDVDIESIDGVITGIKVNGEDYGGGMTWETIFNGNVTTEISEGYAVGDITGFTGPTADTIKVTFNGIEYTCNKILLLEGDIGYGGISNSGPDFTEYPFAIINNTLLTEAPGTFSLKIEEPQSR